MSSQVTTRRRSSMLVNFAPFHPSPFDSLPNEVVLHIFSFLDLKSLKVALTLEKRFATIIAQSRKLMNHLPLTVGIFKGSKNREIMEFKRCYREINFIDIARNKWFKYIIQSLQRIGGNVAKANFKNCQFANNITDVLSCFPNVEKLKFISVSKLDAITSDPLDSVMFPKLREVNIEFISSILQIFKNLQLHILQVLQMQGSEWHHLMQFVQQQTELRHLTLIDSSNIPDDLQLLPLREELVMNSLSFLFVKEVNFNKFIDFLMLFVNSVKFLSIVKLEKTENSHKILEAILKNFKSLDGLAVDFDNFPTDPLFFQYLEVNRMLKHLAINSRDLNNSVGFRGIFRVHPFVEHLSISVTRIEEEMQAEDFNYMYDTLKKLHSFFLIVSSTGIINQGFFRNITALNIVNFSKAVDWQEIAQHSPNLNSLIITKLKNPKHFNLASVVTCLKNLSYLEIGDGFSMNQDEMEAIKKHGMKLKALKILKSSWKIEEVPGEMMRKLDIKDLQITLQSSAYENVCCYSNTLFIAPLYR